MYSFFASLCPAWPCPQRNQVPPIVKAPVPVSIVGRPTYPQSEVFHTVLGLRLARTAVPYYKRLEMS